MSIVVTGGAGFIGSMLCKLLIERGDDVVVIDNLRNGRRELIDVLGHKARLLEVDIRDSEAVRRIVKDTRPQGVCHLAAIHFIPRKGLTSTSNCRPHSGQRGSGNPVKL